MFTFSAGLTMTRAHRVLHLSLQTNPQNIYSEPIATCDDSFAEPFGLLSTVCFVSFSPLSMVDLDSVVT